MQGNFPNSPEKKIKTKIKMKQRDHKRRYKSGKFRRINENFNPVRSWVKPRRNIPKRDHKAELQESENESNRKLLERYKKRMEILRQGIDFDGKVDGKVKTANDYGDNPDIRGKPDSSTISLNERWEREYVEIKKASELKPRTDLIYFKYKNILFSVPRDRAKKDRRIKKLLSRDSITILSQEYLKAKYKGKFNEVKVKLKIKTGEAIKKEPEQPITAEILKRMPEKKEWKTLPKHLKLRGASGITKHQIAGQLEKTATEYDDIDLQAWWDSSLTQSENYEAIKSHLNPTMRDMVEILAY